MRLTPNSGLTGPNNAYIYIKREREIEGEIFDKREIEPAGNSERERERNREYKRYTSGPVRFLC